jgi:hypothetical protein
VVDAGIAEVGADDDAIRGGGEGDAVDELSGADQGGATGFAGGSYLTGANAGFDIAGEDDAEGLRRESIMGFPADYANRTQMTQIKLIYADYEGCGCAG